jgi:pSer/pThr/pTyr-binding forkhead associated (FHA) protein
VAVIDGPLTGMSVALSSLPITIGRADDSTIVINDDYVSSHHARLVPNGAKWLLEDLGSTNGTVLDSSKVTAPTEVHTGSQIRIGRTVLEVQP